MKSFHDEYVEKAYKQGREARKRGEPDTANPYEPSGHPRDTSLSDEQNAAWDEGYEDELQGYPAPER
jgi:hypothetical protein